MHIAPARRRNDVVEHRLTSAAQAVRWGCLSFAADAIRTRTGTGTESTYESDDDRMVEESIGGNAQFVVVFVTVCVVDSE